MPLRFVLDEHLRGGGLWQIIQQHNAQGANLVDTVRGETRSIYLSELSIPTC